MVENRVYRLLGLLLCALCVQAREVQAARLRVCTFNFNDSEEIQAFTAHLPQEEFAITDLQLHQSGPDSSLLQICRPNLHCDVVVWAGEFAGQFFGRSGASLSLQQMEEASCQRRCDGIFHQPQEVFLLGCNTLATKDKDSRTPEQYLRVLLDHGIDGGVAERATQLRYGPIGSSFRVSVRRIFMGVPRIYGFASVAPRGDYSAELLDAYFHARNDYARYLRSSIGSTALNKQILSTFVETNLVQAAGLTPSEPGAKARALLCGLYDESQRVVARLHMVQDLMEHGDFLAFVPAIQVFLSRHPPVELSSDEGRAFHDLQRQEGARAQLLPLVRALGVSAVRMEMAHLAAELDWMPHSEFHQLAIDTARHILGLSLTSEMVDVMCEITKQEPIGNAFSVETLPEWAFADPEGLRLLTCLAPEDFRVNARLAASLDSSNADVRGWAAYALSKRLPLSENVLQDIATHLDDPSPQVAERLSWMLRASAPLSTRVMTTITARAPHLAHELYDSEQRAGRAPQGTAAGDTP